MLWGFQNIRKGWATRDIHIYIPVMREYSIGSYYKPPSVHIMHHTTVIDGEGNCVWEYLTAEQNRDTALLHEDTLRKRSIQGVR